MRCLSHRMCSSVTVKALQSGWQVLSQMAGFFSAATEVCPVTGAELMCRALAMDESKVSLLMSGPTPAGRGGGEEPRSDLELEASGGPCSAGPDTHPAVLSVGPWSGALPLSRPASATLLAFSPKTAVSTQRRGPF